MQCGAFYDIRTLLKDQFSCCSAPSRKRRDVVCSKTERRLAVGMVITSSTFSSVPLDSRPGVCVYVQSPSCYTTLLLTCWVVCVCIYKVLSPDLSDMLCVSWSVRHVVCLLVCQIRYVCSVCIYTVLPPG